MNIEIELEKIIDALNKANPKTKETLMGLFRDQLITSFEDACQRLGIHPILPKVDDLREKDAKHIIATYKLSIITEALNDGWTPDFNNWNEKKCYVYLLGGTANSGVYAGLGIRMRHSVAYTHTYFGSHLCFKNENLLTYSVETFKDLWKDYFSI